MYCKIVIPSHKRHDNVLSKKLVNNPIICVPESQKDLYKDYNPDCEIVAHPDSVVGLVSKRNWMVNHFNELFMLDDDVIIFKKLYIEEGESNKVSDKSEITRQIYSLYELAKMTNINLFGFTKIQHPRHYEMFKHYSLNKMITGCAYGVIKSPNTFWEEDLKLKEDFWISCYIKHTERKILVNEKYSFTKKDTFVSAGGLAEFRNRKTEEENMLKIKKYFGSVISIKRKNNILTPSKVENNISCKFPF